MNRIDRLVGLILYLQSRRVATAEAMAEHFGRSVRTIYRDLHALGECGVPIAAEAGVGYRLLRGYHLPPVNFSEQEACALATSAVFAGRSGDADLRRNIDSALAKIRAVLPGPERDRSLRLEQGLGTAAQPAPPGPVALSLVQRALVRCRALRFSYQGYGKDAPEERTVEPLGLVYYCDRWHLIAWCRLRRAYRDFRVDRLAAPEMLAESFAPHQDFSLAAFLKEAMPEPGLRAEVFFDAASVDRARREWWPGLAAEAPAAGGAVLTLRAVSWPHLAAWLLSFGRGARVLSPPTLAPLVVELALEAARHHAGDAAPSGPA
ncbi:YafY family protein [Solidesulfovibrio sp.]|uniref:helix-turn-helix transcriptional regulator n=1 Tax=Solidesulfovibrio sp. TaxID=2910990 RepID=UPI002616DED4|nr:YafY family protein [Solidesulfovibrio sp.]